MNWYPKIKYILISSMYRLERTRAELMKNGQSLTIDSFSMCARNKQKNQII